MRITQDFLHKYARETVKKHQRSEMDLHAAYLTGSLLGKSPLLGGTTDIDLILVHKFQVPMQRECQPITPEVSLDIFHTLREDYEEHKQLRHDPYLGYPLTNNHILLYDHEHWLEFIQSCVSADFHRPDNVLARVNGLITSARDHWLSLTQNTNMPHIDWLDQYLETLSLAANGIAGLIGPPLTRRRFLMEFSARTESLGTPKVLIGFYGLLGFTDVNKENLSQWTTALAPCRHPYYLEAIYSLSDSDTPEQSAWLLLRTWLDARLSFEMSSPGAEAWENCLSVLGLTQESASQKTEALDAYLDNIEVIIETWSDEYGL